MAKTEDIEAKLAAYVDGELDAAGRAQIEKHLTEHPQHRQLIADLMQQRTLIQSLPLVAVHEQPAVAVTLTVSVTNGGVQDASGIAVAIPLPAGLTFVSDTGSGALAGVTWTIAALAAGSTATLQLVARVDTVLPVTASAGRTSRGRRRGRARACGGGRILPTWKFLGAN